jgi:hypothetical protein
LKFLNEEEIEKRVSPKGHQGDGLSAVIPSECEGSKKDFSWSLECGAERVDMAKVLSSRAWLFAPRHYLSLKALTLFLGRKHASGIRLA